jgi:hypothetical protein
MNRLPDRVRVDARPHGIVLVGAFARSFALTGAGFFALTLGWPATVAAAFLLALAAVVSLRAVWSWERTRIVGTTEKLVVVRGTLRRRTAGVRLAGVVVEIEQSLPGRVLGYGTILAGELEITHVPKPRQLLERIAV